MRRFFISEEQSEQAEHGMVTLAGSDVNHIVHVLRMGKGDSLILNTTNGQELCCVIEAIRDGTVACRVVSVDANHTEPRVRVTLLQGIPKGEKMELIVQKSVELGVCSIVPVQTERTVMRFHTPQDAVKKQQRWQKIAEEASKQCGRGIIPTIHPVQSVEEALKAIPERTLRLVAYENEQENSLKERIRSAAMEDNIEDIAVFIGPEGGIASNEFALAEAYGFKSTSLGRRILRTETAGISVLAALRYEFED